VQERLNSDTRDVEIHFNPSIPVETVLDEMKQEKSVVFAEPDYIMQALHPAGIGPNHTPNDPYYDEPYESHGGPAVQWHLPRIDAPEAWDRLKSVKSDIKLAIIDTGIDFTHPDLKNQMARNSKGEMIGRNFIKPRVDFKDDNGHGTHCAGIADAETDNNVGVAGVGFNSFQLVGAN